ncbi:putative ABC transport system permease protein [Roseateles asaccharophilus]|uniref:Putative ABC transport system permease protein n=1 Tax=Roseateles asaccharophilus TaxID=582607 RepID=A0A4R6N398_9BURK|nr:ABC transporter permease [Roseateles asaccharophilus]TDP09629.1 putative ABC transport system permease protein [Roseateles asaccharophilus]
MVALAPLTRWLHALSWPMARAQAGRQLLALLAIALGVALAYGVQLLNDSALGEFEAAQRQITGTPDLVLAAEGGGPLSDEWPARLAALPGVQQSAPVLEASLSLLPGRQGLRLLGLDALQSAQFRPALLPQPFVDQAADAGPLAVLAPDAVYLNEAALRLLPSPRPSHISLRWTAQGQTRSASLRLAGRVASTGAPLAVMDIAGAQALLGRLGELDRVELRLAEGATAPPLSAGLKAVPAEAGRGEDLAALSRAYRVNLSVLALMALFTGAFLVFAVQSLAAAQRQPQLALLGVLGLSARERFALVLAEAALLGLLGSALGLLGGAGLAALGLQLLDGDLGSGLLGGGGQSRLHIEPLPLLIYGGLGLAVAMLGAIGPAWQARHMAPAQVLKGLGAELLPAPPVWLGPLLLLAGAGLAWLPAWGGLPLAAYLAMLCMLLGGLLCVPPLVRALGALLPGQRHAGLLLLRQRAREGAGEAAQLLAGVLVALALSVAMLVMIYSFRASLTHWLQQMLPADLYVRSTLRDAGGARAPLSENFVTAVAEGRGLPALRDWQAQRSRRLALPATVPGAAAVSISLMARPIPDENRLPLVGTLGQVPAPGLQALYINEALRDQLGLQPGARLSLPGLGPQGQALDGFVRGVWRDYSRQSGALMMPLADYRRFSGDMAVNELFLWLREGANSEQVQSRLRALAGDAQDIELAASGDLLALSLHIFDRSFAVSYWLQAIALGLGLVGVAATLSAQVLARRREFGLLRHLGFSRAQLRTLLLAETAVQTTAGALLGLGLGLAISAVLVFVVNPQSFHWSMDLALPTARLAALLAATLAATLAAALLTAWLAGRRSLGQDLLRAVREDW